LKEDYLLLFLPHQLHSHLSIIEESCPYKENKEIMRNREIKKVQYPLDLQRYFILYNAYAYTLYRFIQAIGLEHMSKNA